MIFADFYFYSTMIFLFLSSLPFLMYLVHNEKQKPFYFQINLSYYYVSFVLLLGIWLFFTSLFYYDVLLITNIINVITETGIISNTSFVNFSRLFIIFSALIALVFSNNYLKSVKYNHFEFYLFILYSTLGSLILVSSNHALLTYLAIELQSLSLYLMSSSQRKSIYSIESGIKYMFIGSLASGALLLGIAYLYILTGSLDFTEISLVLFSIYHNLLLESNDFTLFFVNEQILFLYFGVALIILSLLIKIAAAPFHMWLADVYEGSPTSATIYFLLVPKIAILSVFYRLTHEVFFWGLPELINKNTSFYFILAPSIAFSVIYSFIIGYSGLLNSKITLKKFFAFSSIGHVGFILLPFIFNLDNSSIIITDYKINIAPFTVMYSLVLYVFLYVLLTIPSIKAILLFTSPIIKKTISRRIHYSIEKVPSIFHVINPANGLFIFVLFITFVGIPPTVGFFMKLAPLTISLINPTYITILLWPVILFSSYVYVKVIIILFFKDFDIINPRVWSPINTSEGYLSTWISANLLLFLVSYSYQSSIVETIVTQICRLYFYSF